MTDLEKINELKCKASKQFLDYQNTCHEIEAILSRHSDKEILEVLYQMSDGLVVAVPSTTTWGGIALAPDNFPIDEFIIYYTRGLENARVRLPEKTENKNQ